MLRDDDRLLIASALDGELPSSDAARVRTLLAESVEANELYRRLKSDRDRLTALPKPKAPDSVARAVASRIEPLVVPSTLVPRGDRPLWGPYTIVAGVFFAVGAGILMLSRPDSRDVARLPEPPRPDPANVVASGPDAVSGRESLPAPDTVVTRQQAGFLAKRDILPNPTPANPPQPGDFLTAPAIGSSPRIAAESARLPLLFPFTDVEQDPVRSRLTEEFSASPAVRLDVFSRDVAKSLELFNVAARSNGIVLSTSPVTADQVKRKLPVTVAIYVETLSARDLTTLMGRWAKVDSATKSLDRGHVFPAGVSESRELKALLGVDPGLGKRSKDDPGKSLSDGTADQVAKQMGKGSAKLALALTFTPAAARVPPGLSAEVKQFVEKRGDLTANAVPCLILLKPSN